MVSMFDNLIVSGKSKLTKYFDILQIICSGNRRCYTLLLSDIELLDFILFTIYITLYH